MSVDRVTDGPSSSSTVGLGVNPAASPDVFVSLIGRGGEAFGRRGPSGPSLQIAIA